MRWRVSPAPISGACRVPGDKSISHRVLMLAALATGESEVRDLAPGQDVLATATCLRALGVEIEIAADTARIRGDGSLRAAAGELDAANSGTTMRLLAGLLAGQGFDSRLVGDRSLSRRPMGRVIEPLSKMGAAIESREGMAPLTVHGRKLHGANYRLPMPSAQVKSAILLAALMADGVTRVIEPAPVRDHTERLFQAVGIELSRQNGTISLEGGGHPRTFRADIPGDISTAAFFFAAAALHGSEVVVPRLGVNPTRTTFLEVLGRMGQEVEWQHEVVSMGEPVAEVRVTGNTKRPIQLGGDEIPRLIDELPLVALLATQAPGVSVVRDAGELRVKEADRISVVVRQLDRMGADIAELPDGFVVKGPTRLRGTTVSSEGDHRLAMMLAVAATFAEGDSIVEEAEVAAVSFPNFLPALQSLGASVDG